MKKYLLITSALLFILFIAFLLYRTSLANQSPKQTYTGPVEKIVIGNIGEYSIFNLIAKEKGYFKDHGLDAQVLEYPSGPPVVADLLAGKVDFAPAADYVGVVNIFKNNHLRILSQASSHQVFHVIARKDKGITMPSDLKGKKIGVTRGSAGEYYLGLFVTLNNLSLKDITLIDLPPTEMIAQITQGQLDAVVIFDPHAYNLKKTLGEEVIEWSAQGKQKTFALLYTTDTFITAHPDRVKRYLSAMFDAETFVNEHPEDAQAIVAKALNYEKPYVQYMWGNFTFAHGLEQELLLKMEDEARFIISNNLTDKTEVPNYLDYIYFDGLQAVNPEAVTIIH